MSVRYEWDVETCLDMDSEGNEDIVDHNHTESYAEALADFKQPAEEGTFKRIVLVRDDDKCRSWAYMEEGKLPEYFEDAYNQETVKVPKRFHDEVTKAGN